MSFKIIVTLCTVRREWIYEMRTHIWCWYHKQFQFPEIRFSFVFTMNEMAEVPEPHIKFRFSFGGVEIRSSFHLRIFAKSLSFTHPSGNLLNTHILLRTKSLVVVENVFICFVSEIYWTITLALKGKQGFWFLSNRQTSYYRRTALKTMLKNPWGDTHGACEEIK